MKIISRMAGVGAFVAAGAVVWVAGAAAQAPGGRQGVRSRVDATGGPTVGDAVPRIELQRLDAAGDAAKPGGGREPLVDHAKKRPVVLIFSSFT